MSKSSPITRNDELLYVVAAATLGALATLAWRACRATHARRCGGRCTQAPADLRDWEGEGGRPLPDEPEARREPDVHAT